MENKLKQFSFLDILVIIIGILALTTLIMLLLFKPIIENRYYRLGEELISKNNINQALKEINYALKLNYESSKLHEILGRIYIYKKDYLLSIKELEKAIEIDNNNYYAYLYLGISYYQQGKYNESINQLEKAISLDIENKNNSQAFYYIAKSYYNQGFTDLSILKLEDAIKIDEKNSEAFFELGKIYFEKQNIEKSIEYLNKSLLIKNTPDTNYYLGLCYENLGQLDNSIYYLKEAIRLNFSDNNIYYILGNIYFKKSLYQEAIIEYEKFVKNNPNDAISRYKLGNLYFNIGNYKYALEHYNKAISIDSTYKEILKYNIKEASNIIKVKNNIKKFQKLLEDFYLKNNHYPENIDKIYKNEDYLNYCKKMFNPYKNSNYFYDLFVDYNNYLENKNKFIFSGYIVYEPINYKNKFYQAYKLYAIDGNNNFIKYNSKDLIISNNSIVDEYEKK
ncbi:MAG: hypothetical protein KatS3mg068_0599 [Candidatus Sericytochromatia bacterium]|nr:MAG: hypothetical protein KatS3mg068_0599 [Candidatus Sericytochromatia bacterium]